MHDSASTCDETIESYEEEVRTAPTNFNKKATCKTQNFSILLAFLLITITLLIAVSNYCHLMQNKNIYYHFAAQIAN